MKKIEVHLFGNDTHKGKTFRLSFWKVLWISVGIGLAILGFALFSPTKLMELVLDRQIVKIYSENRALKREVKESEIKLEGAKQKLKESSIMRDSLFNDKSIQHVLQNNKDLPLVTAKENLKDALLHRDSLLRILSKNNNLAHALPIALPVKGKYTVTNRFQMIYDPFTEQMLPHKGIDFAATAGDTVYATANGIILEQRTHRGFGITLKIEHTKHIRTFYAHLKESLVPVGKAVKRGEPIAIVGNSGRSVGVTLHYEIRYDGEPVNPEAYFLNFSP